MDAVVELTIRIPIDEFMALGGAEIDKEDGRYHLTGQQMYDVYDLVRTELHKRITGGQGWGVIESFSWDVRSSRGGQAAWLSR